MQNYTYDALGNVTSQTRYVTSIFAGGSFSEHTDAGLDARVVVNAHDATGQFRHNAMGRIIWHLDATGNTESTRYDSVGWTIGRTDKGGGEWTYRCRVPQEAPASWQARPSPSFRKFGIQEQCFHLCACPWRAAQELQAGLHARLAPKAIDVDAAAQLVPAIVLDQAGKQGFQGNAVQGLHTHVREGWGGKDRQPVYPPASTSVRADYAPSRLTMLFT